MSALPVTPLPEPVPEEPSLSEPARLINTFIAPSKTFTDFRRNASWWAPWLLISIFTLLFIYAMDRQVGFDQITRNSIARSSKAEQFEKLPPDQQAKQIQISNALGRGISYGLPLVDLLVFLIIAGVLTATFNVVGGASVPFKRAYAIVVYASLPGIIGAVLGVISLFAGVDPAGFEARNPVATNPAYFMDPSGNKFLYGMASALDIFVIWSIVLMGIGFACNSKVKRGNAIALVASWYLVYKLAGATMAAIF